MSNGAGDVLACVAKVVQAFRSCADLVAALTERRDKKKRRKDKDRELAVQEKMLHRSFVDAATQCSTLSQDKYHSYGPAFSKGDHIAMSGLKDVVISLQGDIMHALQVDSARADIDLMRLYELSITNKNAALRAMEDLCNRITRSLEPVPSPRESPHLPQTFDARQPSHSRYHSYSSAISPRGTVAELPTHRPSPNPSSYDLSYAHASHRLPAATPPNTQHAWAPLGQSPRDLEPRLPPYREHDHAYSLQNAQEDPDELYRQFSNTSLIDSVLGSPGYPNHPSISSISAASRYRTYTNPDTKPRYHSGSDYGRLETDSIATSMSTRSTESGSDYSRTRSTAPEHAPEVVTSGYEPMLTQQTTRESDPYSLLSISSMHPALRPDNPLEYDEVWTPLARPARHNNYHNFCKGAWQARKSLCEGFSICMLPNSNGEDVPHWKCKHCEFRSKGTRDTDHLPDQIYFHNRTGARYRWMFLANSHQAVEKPRTQAAKYPYGCIFCAAQGRETADYEDLDALMNHVSSKHKTALLTPEVKGRTRCMVGGAPDRTADWDINLPVSSTSRFGDTMTKLFAESVTGLR